MEKKHEVNSSMQFSSSDASADGIITVDEGIPSSSSNAAADGIISFEENMPSSSYDAAADGTISVEEYFKSMPPGYRFWPEDSELVEHYLRKKVNNETLPPNLIPDVKFYDYDPSSLAGKYEAIKETEWYFFTPRYKKYPNGARPDRGTPGGYWKPTGTERPILAGSGNPLGFKRPLDFYQGKHQKGEKTHWKMHEYTLKASDNNPQSENRDGNDTMLDAWVLCKLYKKSKGDHEENDAATEDQQPPSSINVGEHESNAATSLDQQPMSVNVSSSLAMLQGNNNNNNELTGIVASQNIGEASSSSLMLHENNGNRVEFEGEAALIQPITDDGLLQDQMIFTDLDPTVDNREFWAGVLAYCSAPDVPSSPQD